VRVSSTGAGTLEAKPWLLWAGVLTIPLPYVAALAGWVLSEVGRQPWIVWASSRRADANSPSVSTTTIAFSLGMFALLYGILAIVDFVLMRALRAARSARYRWRGRRVLRPGGVVLMDLETFWFCLIAVLWAGYFLLEGFDFGVGMLLPFVPRDDAERSTQLSTIGPVWDGNEVWLVVAGGATFAAFPAWVRDDVLGLLHRAAARPLLPHHPRRLVRVALEERDAGLARAVDVGEHDRQRRGIVRMGRRPLRTPLRDADRLERRLRGQLLGPLQSLHRPSPGSASSSCSHSTARRS
jgi:hypothetical protein